MPFHGFNRATLVQRRYRDTHILGTKHGRKARLVIMLLRVERGIIITHSRANAPTNRHVRFQRQTCFRHGVRNAQRQRCTSLLHVSSRSHVDRVLRSHRVVFVDRVSNALRGPAQDLHAHQVIQVIRRRRFRAVPRLHERHVRIQRRTAFQR